MDKRSYHKELEKILSEQAATGMRPSLLLHACCGPCATHVLEKLVPYFSCTIWYDNSNIYPREEYDKRCSALQKVIKKIAPDDSVCFWEGAYDPKTFFTAIQGHAHLGEGSARCEACIRMRLESTARRAAEMEIEWFASTLSISPHKNAQQINDIGESLAKRYGVKFLPNDFKKGGGFQRSIALCKEWDIYRQDYCGCMYSFQERNTRPMKG